MSHLAWMAHAAPMGFAKPAPLRTRAKYEFINLVRPDCYDLYTVEQQFGIFRWMVETAAATVPTPAETGRWGASNPLCLLNGHPTCVNDHEAYGIRSIEDLRKRFHYALLSGMAGASAVRWRQENGVNLTDPKILNFPHYAPFGGAPLQGNPRSEAEVRKALSGLLSHAEPLRTQLNEFHNKARESYGVTVHVRPQGFEFRLNYGFDGSIWQYTLSATPKMWSGEGETFRYNKYGKGSEPFINTLDRAITELRRIQEGA